MIHKIAIVGPESTGKSALAKSLSSHFDCPWVPEVARYFLENLDRPYECKDVEAIAREQLAAEELAEAQNPPIMICDTNLLVIKIWMMHAWGHCPDWIIKNLESRKYTLTLLCDIDLPWEPDPLREHPHLRSYFISWYEKELKLLKADWAWIKGQAETRNQLAISLVKNHLDSVLGE
jgi:nicotinamide riboside kinase